ncbi:MULTISPECIES: glycerophosphodiester phosphodiesterase [Staphylococcus]|uniref:Glycerophosphodiester phosphodiesterase family protein n=1 Tax=Staphylococcus hsinchuensis TaxID=3051183 RepID=A0ABZ3EBZ4_9STAP|nr:MULTISPECIES: glycerophosphodiester phosphodiesterase family protein [unclassified Staphylococcus]
MVETHGKNITLVAHRGLSLEYPENTKVAYKAALKENIDILEIDIHRTKDDYFVAIHDDTINRTSNGEGKIRKETLEELKKYDIGAWKDIKYSASVIQTLDEVIELIKDHPQKLLIELKDPSKYRGIEEEIVEFLHNSDLSNDRIIVQSFNHKTIKKMYKIGVEFELGVLVSKRNYWYKLPRFKKISKFAHYVNPNAALVRKRFIKKAHEYNLKVMPYTVNAPKKAKSLIDLGVDGLISDTPDTLLNEET